MIALATVCPWCSSTNVVNVNEHDWETWHSGVPVQKAFPYLNADERELVKTGICPTCWEGLA